MELDGVSLAHDLYLEVRQVNVRLQPNRKYLSRSESVKLPEPF